MPARRLVSLAALVAVVALCGGAGLVVAQEDDVETPVDASGSFEVGGVQVDVTAKTPEAARNAGWRLAQRKGWTMLSERLGAGGGLVSDGTLDSMVSGIIVENEQIGPNRYIARLGVLFNRARAGAVLGVSTGLSRSVPTLVIPVEWTGGTRLAFEANNDWQQAWARHRTGNSAIDYVRPAGSGPDSLLLNAGLVTRPGRGWWRTILDQYGAYDVVVPVVKLYRQWPGGPIVGQFEARHGPDNRLITQFSLRVAGADALPVLLDAGVRRIDDAYQNALRNGMLAADPSLADVPAPTPTPTATDTAASDLSDVVEQIAPSGGSVIALQYDSPGAGAVNAAEAALRAVPGVKSASTTSLALGGVSVMRVVFDAAPDLLRTQLESRGWQVTGSGTTLRVRRAAPPVPPADNATGG